MKKLAGFAAGALLLSAGQVTAEALVSTKLLSLDLARSIADAAIDAWTRTPAVGARSVPTGITKRSPAPAAEMPTKTARPRSASGATEPARRSAAAPSMAMRTCSST